MSHAVGMIVVGVALLLTSITSAGAEQTCSDSGYRCTTGGYSGQNVWDSVLDSRGHNCVAYVRFKLAQNGASDPGIRGDAYLWKGKAGNRFNTTPAAGSIAWWDRWTGGAKKYGHVAYVEEVAGDGSWIRTSEDNWGGGTTARVIRRGDADWPGGFIHIKDLPTQPTGSIQPASAFVGRMVRHPNGQVDLVRADGRRYWVPSGGDWQALANNGVQQVQVSAEQFNAIPAGTSTATVRRIDDAALGGPSKWWWHRSNTTGNDGDYDYTYAGRTSSATSNFAQWAFGDVPAGRYNVKAYVPLGKATARVVYEVWAGPNRIAAPSLNQAAHYGYVSVVVVDHPGGPLTIRVNDNQAAPYNAPIGIDAMELLPL